MSVRTASALRQSSLSSTTRQSHCRQVTVWGCKRPTRRMLKDISLGRSVGRLVQVRPVLWNKRGWFAPWIFNQSILEPLVTQIRMFGHDDLEARNFLFRVVQ